jgi:hypothetical protein
MNNLRKNLKQIPVIQTLSSIKITVTCLGLLFILTLWGTIAQIDQGLYLAQERFFFSWFFLIFGFLPFPGAKLVLWVFFLNLVCNAITRFVYKWSHLGILIIHIGLLTYFLSAFVTFYATKESQVTLLEGEGSNVSLSYHDWELSVWPAEKGNHKTVYAYDLNPSLAGHTLTFPKLNLSATIVSFYPNTQAYRGPTDKSPYRNDSGISSLNPVGVDKEPEKNMPGVTLQIRSNTKFSSEGADILLYAGESKPNKIRVGHEQYNVQLRRKRNMLPFVLTLKKFEMEVHPGTEIAKSYQSLVEIEHDKFKREVLIYMNHPLRYKDYTLYQASYSIDQLGQKRSTLAIVKNVGRGLPYVSSLITFAGLVTHFLLMGLFRKKKNV